MNFDDKDGPQRSINEPSDSLDRKIAASPSAYLRRSNSSSSPGRARAAARRPSEEDDNDNNNDDNDNSALVINSADVLCGRGKQSFNHGPFLSMIAELRSVSVWILA